jgi:DHA3 family macrolide efflux protein-like MFS transporter
MISAALMTLAPLHTLFFIDVVTAAIGITIVLFFVKVPANLQQTANETSPQKKGAYFRELKEGLAYIRNHGYVLRMIIISAIFCFLSAPPAFLTPLQVARKFGEDVWRLSALEVAFSGGMMAGGILIGAWGGLKNRAHTMALACSLCGLLTVGLGWSPLFWLYLSIMALLGLSLPLYNTPAMVLLQTTVEPAFMGRVLSIFSMVTSALMPMGMLLFGPLADVVSIDIILVISGLLVSLLCIPMLTSKTLRAAGVIHLIKVK